jgi:hypothetical protein
MSDTTYQLFQHYGTAAERAAFVPDPAAGIQPIYIWYETDTGDTYLYDTTWHLLSSGGGGNINVSAGTTSNLLSALTFSNSNNLSFGLNASTITAIGAIGLYAVSNTTQSTTGTADLRSLSFAGAGVASVGITGNSVVISVPAGGGGLTNINVSAGTTSNNLSAITFSNSNGVSFGLNASNINLSAGTTSNNLSAAVFSNSNNVSFGLNGSTVTASATVASSQGSINVSAGTTSGNVSAVTFSNSNGFSFGLNAGTITGSYTVPTVPAQFSGGNSNLGNTLGDTGVVTGRLVLVGTNNITLSGSTNGGSMTISISGAAAAGNTGSISAGTTRATLGEVVFSNSNGISFGVNGQTVTGSVATSLTNINVSAGTTSNNLSAITFSNSNGISFGLNASTLTASVATSLTNINLSAGTTSNNLSAITFSNSNNVSFGLNGSTVTATATVASTQGSIRISAGTTSVLSSAFTFSNSNNVSFGMNTDGIITATATMAGGGSVNVSAGTTSNNLTAITFSNSNGISFGLNASTITASVATSLTNINFSAGTTSNNLSAITFSNSNNVSFGLNGSTVTATATVASSQGSIRISAGTTSILSSGFTFLDSNRVSFGIDNGTVTAKHALNFSAGTTSNNVSDQIIFSNSNNVSFGLNGSTITGTVTVASTQASISFSAGTTSNNSSGFTFSNSNNVSFGLNAGVFTATATVASTQASISFSAGTTSNNSSGFTFSNSNNVSFGLNAGVFTATATFNQTNQTVGLYMSSNTTSSVSSGTVDARSMTFRGVGVASVGYSGGEVIISVPAGGGGITNINLSAGTTSNNLSNFVLSDSNGVSFGLNGSTITATVNTYSTVGTATSGYPVASANSVGTITRWAAEDHRHAGVGGIGISTSGNTAGTTGSNVGTYWIEGGNNITVSQITSNNGSHTLVLSGPATGLTNIRVSAGTTSNLLSALTFSDSNGVSFGINASTITASVAALGTASMWPYPLPGSTAVSTYYSASTSQGAGGGSTQSGYTISLYAVPLVLPTPVAFSELRVGVSNQSVAATGSATHMYSVGLYTNNASTLSALYKFYGGIVLSQNSVTAQTFSVFTASTGGATSGAGGGMAGISKASIYSSQGNISANSQIFGRMQFIRIDSGAAITLTEGQYWMVFGNATASSNANVLSQVGVLQSDAIQSINIPDLGRENSTQSSNYLPVWGAISTTFTSQSSAATFFPLPNGIAFTNMSLSSSAWYRYHFPFVRNLS